MKLPIFSSNSESLIFPKLVQIRENYICAAFDLMKLFAAKGMLDAAEKQGKLRPGSHVVESSSGTLALALAFLCKERGYRLTIISDPVIDEPLHLRLLDLGVNVDIVEKPEKIGGFQKSRLNRLFTYLKDDKHAFWPQQYDNEHNPEGYESLSNALVEAIPKIDIMVISVGSGGSSKGLSRYLRQKLDNLQIIGVDSLKSVTFGRQDGHRDLRGLGSSIYPKNVDYAAFDQISWLRCDEAFLATRKLHRDYGLYLGPTSGAVHLVADWMSRHNPTKNIVSICPDNGYRYEVSVYSDRWLEEKGLSLKELPKDPLHLSHPSDEANAWSLFHWQRRSFKDVMGFDQNDSQ